MVNYVIRREYDIASPIVESSTNYLGRGVLDNPRIVESSDYVMLVTIPPKLV